MTRLMAREGDDEPVPIEQGNAYYGPVSDGWLNTTQACEYMAVTRDWLYDRVAKKEIPYVKLDRLLRFKRSELAAWMEAHRE